MDSYKYVTTGRLWRRSCFNCKGHFMGRSMEVGEDQTGKCFATKKSPGWYCQKCEVVFCHVCYLKYVAEDAAKKTERTARTPRKGRMERVLPSM